MVERTGIEPVFRFRSADVPRQRLGCMINRKNQNCQPLRPH